MSDTQVVVLMGGLGTRLGLKDMPKSMADVHGKPFFDWQLRLMKRWGFRRFLLLIGYMGDKIRAYYGDGSAYGVEIAYSSDGDAPKGTGGAIIQAGALLDEDFLLIYGDSFLDIDYQEMIYHYLAEKGNDFDGMMAIFKNNDRLDKSNVRYAPKEPVLYDKRNPLPDMEYIDYGVSILRKRVFPKAEERFDLADLLEAVSVSGKLAGHLVTRRFYEIGSPKALDAFRKYVQGRFLQKKPAAFFDRDGVINEIVFNEETEQLDSPFSPEEFRYLPGVVEALSYFQKKGYRLFIVTNQPAAAKGKVSTGKLYELNAWLQKDLRRQGIEIEFISMCPHHPQGTEYTKECYLIQPCGCRKPEAGLITDIMSVYGIDVTKSFMVGDSYTDVIAAKRAGIHAIFLGDMKCDVCKRMEEHRPDMEIKSLWELKEKWDKEAENLW